jgi:glycogen phosphorylase
MTIGTWEPSSSGVTFRGRACLQTRQLIIKFINNLAGTIDGDSIMRGRMKVVFLLEYNISLVEDLIVASDVSNQIPTTRHEASGTGSMKFTMNGALTVGALDGATFERAEEAGKETDIWKAESCPTL